MNKSITKQAVEYASSILGLSEIEVHFKPQSFFPHKDVNAMFIPNAYYIIFNEDWLKNAKELEVLKCAFHETRHAYQRACIDFPEIMKHDKNEVEVWKREFSVYKNPNFNGYLDQEIEKDAVFFSEKLINKIQEEAL